MAKSLSNHSDSPLVTAQIMTHSGDVHLLPRALESVAKQSLEPKDMQIQIVFDGMPTQEEEEKISELCKPLENTIHFFGFDQKWGYYCVPRNKAVQMSWGFYIAHLDADNEWKPNHLAVLLEAIRIPGPDGWPHFVYSRRDYVADQDIEGVPLGPSKLYEWTPENCGNLVREPVFNFVDTGDFLIGKGTLWELAERTGFIWNPNCRRFGDWELMTRVVQSGIRGKAVDEVTHIYHWTGDNLQLTRKTEELIAIPETKYEQLAAQGLVVGRKSNGDSGEAG